MPELNLDPKQNQESVMMLGKPIGEAIEGKLAKHTTRWLLWLQKWSHLLWLTVTCEEGGEVENGNICTSSCWPWICHNGCRWAFSCPHPCHFHTGVVFTRRLLGREKLADMPRASEHIPKSNCIRFCSYPYHFHTMTVKRAKSCKGFRAIFFTRVFQHYAQIDLADSP